MSLIQNNILTVYGIKDIALLLYQLWNNDTIFILYLQP